MRILEDHGVHHGERDALQSVRDLALSLDVKLDVIAGERAFVSNIVNLGEKGAGSKVIAALCAECDKLGLRIALNAKDGEPFLINLYEGFGFTIVDERDDEGPLMVRQPKGTSA